MLKKAAKKSCTKRMAGTDELKDSEIKLRAIFDQTYQFIGLLTLDGTLIDANRTALQLSGIELSSVINKPFWNTPWWTHSAELQEKVKRAVKRAAKGEFVRFEASHPAKDGTLHYVDFSLKPIKDEKGKIIYLVPEGRDITEHKEIEEKLKEKDTLIASLIQNSAVATFVIDSQHKVMFWNAACEELTGIKGKELIGTSNHWKAFYDFTHPTISDLIIDNSTGSINKFYKFFSASNLIPSGIHAEGWYPRLGGKDRYIVFDAAPIYSDNNKLIAAIETLQDITALKRAEEIIRKNSEEIEDLYNNAPCGYHSLDENEVFTKINNTELLWLGFTRDEIIGKIRFTDVLSKKSADSFKENLRQFKENGKIENLELELIRKDGSSFPIIMNANAMKDSAGIFAMRRSTIFDITDRIKAEEANKKLMAMKEAFTSMASHELRTPLTPIKEAANMILDGSAGIINEKQKELLILIQRNADRLVRLTNDILSFQKLEAGKETFSFQENDISRVINEVQNVMTLITKDKNLHFSVEIENDIPRTSFDADKITQVLTNLINNAIKFTEKGGIKVKAFKEENVVHVIVEDTGPGIKKEDIPKLFQGFVQLDAARQKKLGGTGLGLAISKEIIIQHKGKIWVESEEGKGSSFHFVLPILERRA